MVEHINHFTMQCGKAMWKDIKKLKVFAHSLTGSMFIWYTNLLSNSIQTWKKMEQKFHEQFYRIEFEVSMVDLSHLYQRDGKSVENFIAQFKMARNKCHLDIP